MSENPGMSFDPEAMSARLEELTETLCHIDYVARDAGGDQDKMAEVSMSVSGIIFNLPLAAIPTVIMFLVAQLNMARGIAAERLESDGVYADTIVDVVSRLAAQDVDMKILLELVDVADVLRAAADTSPYIPCDHMDHAEGGECS
jgi:hypothetical protein